MIKYQKAIQEDEKCDRRLIEIQRELSESRYNSHLNSTLLTNRHNDWEQSQDVFGRKFSWTGDRQLSNTIIHHNDSNVANATTITPSKDYGTDRVSFERDHAHPNNSSWRESEDRSRSRNIQNAQAEYIQNLSSTQLQKSRLKTGNLFSTK